MSKFFGDRAFYKRVLTITLPIILQNLVTSFVSLLDNIMVGRLGTEAMSGVSIANQLNFVFNLAIFGAFSGIGIFTAQFFGAKDKEGVRYTMRAKFVVSFTLLVLYLALAVWKGRALISLFLTGGDAPELVEKTLSFGHSYLLVSLLGMVPFTISQIYASTVRESGETRLPMIASIIAVFVNLVFNYILIFGKLGAPALGVAGAAAATVIARVVEMSIVVVSMHRRKVRFDFLSGLYKSLYIPKNLILQMLRRGTPLLINEFLWSLSMTAITQSYSTRGLTAVAANSIANTVFNIFSQAYFAMGSAIAIMVGQLLGAGKEEEAVDTDRKVIVLAVVMSLGLGIIAFFLAPLFPQIYNTTEEVRETATRLLRICCMMMPLYAFVHSCYFTIRSGGKTVVTFFFDCVYMWAVAYPVSFILSRYTSLDMPTLYLCVELMNLIKAAVGYILVRKRIWVNNLVKDLSREGAS